jgi:hypothetical protein
MHTWVQNAASRDHPALPSFGRPRRPLATRGSARRPSPAARGSAMRLSAAAPMPCISSKRESSRPALHMCGQWDGASLTPTAVDTRSSARTTTAVLELPDRRAPLKRCVDLPVRIGRGRPGSLGGGLEIQCPTMTPARGNCGRRCGPWPIIGDLALYLQGRPCSMACRT